MVSREPIPGKHALGTDDEVFTEVLDGAQKLGRLGEHIPVQELVAITI
jgi:hypothetical protein